MKYGARYIRWAPFAEGASSAPNAVPSYGTAVGIGALQKVTDNPAFNTAKAYGDDGIVVQLDEYKENIVAVEITTIPQAVATSMFGAESVSESDGGGTQYGTEDKAPFGGLGFVSCKIGDDGVRYYQGILYPKVQATLQGNEYTTKGETVTLNGDKVQFTGYAAPLTTGGTSKWKWESDHLATPALACAWVDARLGVSG